MNELPPILTERIDDIPLLLEPRQRRGLPTLFDTHFPTHGNGTGLSLGWVSPIWLSAILSRGDHRRGHVEPWVATRLWTLGVTPGQAVTRVDLTDARRAVVRRRLRHAERWGAFASALHPHTVRVDDRLTQRGHGESPSASASATVREGGSASVVTARTIARTCHRSKGCKRFSIPGGGRWPPMWCRVSGLMPRALCPALRGGRRVWAAAGCDRSGTARGRRGRRAPGSPPRVLFTCAHGRRCNGPRARSPPPWKPSGAGPPPSARWCGRAHRVHGSGVPRALRLPWRCASRWASRCPMGQRGVWWGDRGGRHTRRRWRFAPGWPKRWRRLRLSTSAVAAKSGLSRCQLSGRRWWR